MGSPRHRVVQWATGNTGQRALREVIRDPDARAGGGLVYDDAKDGVDGGELCGEGPHGRAGHHRPRGHPEAGRRLVPSTCPGPRVAGQTHAGLTKDELVDDVVALLGSGTNIVTTVSDLLPGAFDSVTTTGPGCRRPARRAARPCGRAEAIPASSPRPCPSRCCPCSAASS